MGLEERSGSDGGINEPVAAGTWKHGLIGRFYSILPSSYLFSTTIYSPTPGEIITWTRSLMGQPIISWSR